MMVPTQATASPRNVTYVAKKKRYCCVLSCSNNEKNERDKRLSFHSFPMDENLRKQWLLKTGRDSVTITQDARVCSDHFTPSDFLKSWTNVRRLLKKDAIPTVFKIRQHESEKSHREMCQLGQSAAGSEPSPNQTASQPDQPVHTTEPVFPKHDYSEPPRRRCHLGQSEPSPDQASWEASQPVHLTQSSVSTQTADPGQDCSTPGFSLDDQLEAALKRIAELENILAREKSAHFNLERLAGHEANSRNLLDDKPCQAEEDFSCSSAIGTEYDSMELGVQKLK